MFSKSKTLMAVCLFLWLGGDVSEQAGLFEARGRYNSGDYAAAMRMLEPLAGRGHPEALLVLGWMCYSDDVCPDAKDFKKAFEHVAKSAEQNFPLAQLFLHFMYLDGEAVERNLDAALMWLERAANNGVAEAQYGMALRHYQGNGLEQNYKKAFFWAEKAGLRNLPEAQYLLVMLMKGLGAERNPVEGLRQISLSAKNGYDFAQVVFCVISLMRDDDAEAEKWFARAAKKRENSTFLKGPVNFKRLPSLDELRKAWAGIKASRGAEIPAVEGLDEDALETCRSVMRLLKIYREGLACAQNDAGVPLMKRE